MKKTFIYIIILLGLGMVAVGAYLQKKHTNSPEKEKAFAVENIGELAKINLKDKRGRDLTLIKKGEIWLIDGKERVRPGILNNLLEAIEKVQVDSPTPKVALNNVLTEMVDRAIEVNLYKKDKEKPFKTYYVGNGNHNQDGTYMLMKINGTAASIPYLVKLPGFKGVLTYRFIPDVEAWRSLEYCNLMANEIKSISVQYKNENANESFILEKNDDNFTLKTQDQVLQNDAINEVQAVNLYNSFKNLSIEKYINNYTKQDSVMQNLGILDLEIKNIYGDTRKLSVYYMPAENDNERLMRNEDGSYTQFNADRLFAYNHNTNAFISIQFNTFGKIFMTASQLKK